MDNETGAAPDFTAGIPIEDLPDGGLLLGRVGDDAVILARSGDEIFAVGAECSHYHGPLAEGLVVADTIRCPWHHACFSLRTGEAVRAPAFLPLPRWRVERVDGRAFIREKVTDRERPAPPALQPESVGIIGGGAAGFAAAEMLRRKNYRGTITMISADYDAPCDRPNLSKDYLAGHAEEDWLPLQPPAYYEQAKIDLELGVPVVALDLAARRVTLADGRTFTFGAILLATGAEPIHLAVPGATLPHVHLLRSPAQSRAIIMRAATSRVAVVVGASFIGLEVAASLRARGLEVHVVAPEARPMERLLGPEMGDFIRALHESRGVNFHLGRMVVEIDAAAVTLDDGERLAAELVVVGIGVRPVTALAAESGLALDRGISVNQYLETSAQGIYAAGDVARWPDPRSGRPIRVEHWVVAQSMGQTAARNILGAQERYGAVPFFWSQHYDVVICYVGHAEHWDRVEIDGTIEAHDCALRYHANGELLAVATIFRDRESLAAEVAMERITEHV